MRFSVLMLALLPAGMIEAGLAGPGGGPGPLPAADDPRAVVARVGDREITLRDFLERAEYTIRPPYCKGGSNNDKKIVLNSLIAEKLLAIEAGERSGLLKSEGFRNFLRGRREQRMRDVLYEQEAVEKVRLDSGEVQRAFQAAGRTYRVQYLVSQAEADAPFLRAVAETPDSGSAALFAAQAASRGLGSIPELELDWASPARREVHRALFGAPLHNGQVIGPLPFNDTAQVWMRIAGWDERVAVSETDVAGRLQDVAGELTRLRADSIYEKYVLGVMAGKTVRFDADAFNRLTALLVPMYTDRKRTEEEQFLQFSYGRSPEHPPLEGTQYAAVMDLPLLSIDGKVWTIQDLKREMDKHPLIFRKSNLRDKFASQLRLAIVDLIRDRYLTAAAYSKGIDRLDVVVHYEQSWRDASVALYERDQFLKRQHPDSASAARFLEVYMDPHVAALLRKHSAEIEVNVEVFDRIRLTRIDMFATQGDVPYPIYVPAFPVLTTHNRLDYGHKMKS